MKEYLKPLIDIKDIFSNESISAVYNGEELEGSIASTNYIGPENSEW